MAVYIESYPAAFSFKQQTKEFFLLWLEKIRHAYAIEDASIPDELVIGTKEKDTGIAMLKLLHSRAGVTYEELKDGLGGITERAIQKDLVKITPSLYAGEGVPDVPFRLGGQPLLAEIELVDKNETRAKFKRFRTLNSVHPLVLQENIMQLVSNREIICYSLNYLFLVTRLISSSSKNTQKNNRHLGNQIFPGGVFASI